MIGESLLDSRPPTKNDTADGMKVARVGNLWYIAEPVREEHHTWLA